MKSSVIMVFKRDAQIYATEVERKEGEDVLYVNYLPAPFVPSLAKQGFVMAKTMGLLIDFPNVSRMVFVQQRNYHYPSEQVFMLAEIARLINYWIKQEVILSPERLSLMGDASEMYEEASYWISLMKEDPVACYRETGHRIDEIKEQKGDEISGQMMHYMHFLDKVRDMLEKTKLIQKVINSSLDSLGGRSVYESIFVPDVLPNFTFTRLVAQLPEDAELVDQYEIKEEFETITVTILKLKNDAKYFYHIMPPEYSLGEDHYLLLYLARQVMIKHQPKADEFTDTEKTRQVFYNVARDLLSELSRSKGIALTHRELHKLSIILVRHTIGFGLLEVLLLDNKIQDIVVNAPIAQNPIFIKHQNYEECVTNIIPSYEDGDSWAAKLRLQSGRPLDEANPILDSDLAFGKIRARIAAVSHPLSPSGLAYALRRHRDNPWTLPLFVENKMLNSFAAGLLSFMIDGSRTLLVAGTRSSGKCVDGNTLIQLSDGSIKKIKDLVGDFKQNISDGEIYNPKISLVSSLDNMKISSKRISNVWRRSSPDRVMKIRTKSGKEIITTKEHPFFVYSSGLKNTRADELEI